LFLCHSSATSEICSLSLHDALPISIAVFIGSFSKTVAGRCFGASPTWNAGRWRPDGRRAFTQRPAICRRPRPAFHVGEAPKQRPDRKSTRLNSSHVSISYAVFCLKK